MSVVDPFLNELREARLAEAARFDAVYGLQDAKILRLEALREAVLPALSKNETARQLFELSVFPGVKPRLWIDLVSSVVMEPDPKHYRLVQEQTSGRVVVFETDSFAEMQSYLTRYLAHRMVEQARQKLAAPNSDSAKSDHYTAIDLFLVWAAGLGLGVLAVIGWAIWAGRLGL